MINTLVYLTSNCYTVALQLEWVAISNSQQRICLQCRRPRLIPGLGRSPGEGNGNPLQCSCLENPTDGGSWWAAIYGVTRSQTRLKRLSSSSSNFKMHIYRMYVLHLKNSMCWLCQGYWCHYSFPPRSFKIWHSDSNAREASTEALEARFLLPFERCLDWAEPVCQETGGCHHSCCVRLCPEPSLCRPLALILDSGDP